MFCTRLDVIWSHSCHRSHPPLGRRLCLTLFRFCPEVRRRNTDVYTLTSPLPQPLVQLWQDAPGDGMFPGLQLSGLMCLRHGTVK